MSRRVILGRPQVTRFMMPSQQTVAWIPFVNQRVMTILHVALAAVPTVLLAWSYAAALIMFGMLFTLCMLHMWVYMWGHKQAWVIKLMALITGCQAVELLGMDGEKQFTLAAMADDHTGWAHVYWLNGIGSVRLLRTGFVHANSESSYYYIWRYLDTEKQMIMTLTYDPPDWSTFSKLTTSAMAEARRQRQG